MFKKLNSGCSQIAQASLRYYQEQGLAESGEAASLMDIIEKCASKRFFAINSANIVINTKLASLGKGKLNIFTNKGELEMAACDPNDTLAFFNMLVRLEKTLRVPVVRPAPCAAPAPAPHGLIHAEAAGARQARPGRRKMGAEIAAQVRHVQAPRPRRRRLGPVADGQHERPPGLQPHPVQRMEELGRRARRTRGRQGRQGCRHVALSSERRVTILWRPSHGLALTACGDVEPNPGPPVSRVVTITHGATRAERTLDALHTLVTYDESWLQPGCDGWWPGLVELFDDPPLKMTFMGVTKDVRDETELKDGGPHRTVVRILAEFTATADAADAAATPARPSTAHARPAARKDAQHPHAATVVAARARHRHPEHARHPRPRPARRLAAG
jgi:hypothetical protein